MSVSVCQVQVYRPYEHDAPGLLALNVPSKPVQGERKRTTSFSSPPRKRLHRTESYVDLSFAVCASTSTATGTASTSANATAVPYNRTLRFYKEQKERRRALLRRDPPALDAPSACAPSSSSSSSSPSPANSYTSLNPYTSPNSNASSAHAPNTALPLSRPSRPVPPRTHTRAKSTPPPPPAPTCARSIPPSPLCVSAGRVVCARTPPPAVRAPIPCRGPKPSAPPRSSVNTLSAYSSSCSSAIPSASASANGNANKPKKPSPSLHRRAVTACMRASPAGAKILHMGARLAVGIMSATRELERMCGPEGEASGYSSSLDPHEEEDEGEGMEDAEGEDVEPDLDDEEGVEGGEGEGEDEDEEEDEDMVMAMLSDDSLSLSCSIPPPPAMGRLIAASVSESCLPSLPLSTSPMTPGEEDAMDVDAPPPAQMSMSMSASWIVVEGGDWEMVEGA